MNTVTVPAPRPQPGGLAFGRQLLGRGQLGVARLPRGDDVDVGRRDLARDEGAHAVARFAHGDAEDEGVALGGREVDVKKAFPSVDCKPLEWKSDAADRRCDDAQISLDGVLMRITVYLKADVIQAFDLRIDMKDLEPAKKALQARWGVRAVQRLTCFGC